MTTVIKKLAELDRELNSRTLAKKAYDHFKKITPIDSGNARRKTKLSHDTIYANYAYAQRLDQGWSKQAPDGMSNPTIEYLKSEIEKLKE